MVLHRKLLLLAGVLCALLMTVSAVLADTSTSFEFLGVTTSSCSPGHSLGFDFIFSVPDGDFDATHEWTVENLRNGESNGGSVDVDPTVDEFINDDSGPIYVPDGTRSGDTLKVTVIAVSNVDSGDSDSITFVCGKTSSKNSSKGKPFNPGDARLNRYDAGASYSVYCTANGDISVWAIAKDGHSFETFVATAAEIAAVGTNPASATAIDSGAGGDGGVITLYRRSDGYFQLNGPALAPNNLSKTYTVSFNGCPATDVQTAEG